MKHKAISVNKLIKLSNMNKTDKAVEWALIRWTHSDHTSLQNVLIEGSQNLDNFETIAPCQVGQRVSMNARPNGIVLAITTNQSEIYSYAR